MRDPRVERLAELLIDYSVALQPGEKILIEATGGDPAFLRALLRKVYAVGGVPFVTLKDPEVLAAYLEGATKEQLETVARYEAARMSEMDAYIGVRAGNNASELASVPPEKMRLRNQYWWEPVHARIRVPKTRWCVLRYPNHSMAQLAGMGTEAFEDFYFDVCLLDYARMSRAMDALVRRMNATDRVRITGPGTDLTFSIKGMPAVKCDGHLNIPDGEVFTAPVRDSVNGVITFNTPSEYMGFTFENVRLRFENGRIVEATANDTERINHILDTDEGARYVGEFALGFNPKILKPMKDTLFDEKIAGSFHLTPGNAYETADNGNRSAIHWDLVCIQRPEYGGGRIEFDGVVIREDGRFVTPDLLGLNPEHLL